MKSTAFLAMLMAVSPLASGKTGEVATTVDSLVVQPRQTLF